MSKNEEKKIFLTEEEMPRQWYNINPDLPKPLAPPLNPQTGKPLGPDDLSVLFPMELIKQEMSMERFIDIPEELLKIYRMWRPSPLVRAERLEKFLDTPAKIYYKNESVSPAGSHKPNTAIAQAYYNKKEGVNKLSTETGAGQWGSALAFACSLLDIDLTVYMVRCSYDQKPYRKMMMKIWGAQCIASPSNTTEAGKAILAKDPDCTGSLGMAISEAVEVAAKSGGKIKYSLGSVLNHVLMHQSIVGLETKKQLEKAGVEPDILIGCVGGGSNFAGFAFPFIPDKIAGKDMRIVAVEPIACPTLTKGPFAYDYGDTAKMAPIVKMYSLGHDFIPQPIHAGGLRYHGMAPQISLLVNEKIIEAVAVDEALKCKETGEEKVIVFNFSGHGHFDLAAYDAYIDGKLVDYEYPEEKIKESLKNLPKV